MLEVHDGQINIFDIIHEDNSHKKYLTSDHFNLKTRNPRFVYYLQAKGKRVGHEYKIFEFIIWINQKVCKFKIENGFKEIDPLSHIHDFHKRFDAYLKNSQEE